MILGVGKSLKEIMSYIFLKKILFVLFVALFIIGCVPSLHPLYTEKDLILDSVFEGIWNYKDITLSIHKHKIENKAYELIFSYRTSETADYFRAYLIQLGKYQFLDLYPEKPKEGVESYGQYLIPVHTFSKIEINKDILNIKMLNPVIVEYMITNKKINILHERIDNKIVLTAPTKRLQKFVLKHAGDTALFSCVFEFHRQNNCNNKNSENSEIPGTATIIVVGNQG